MGEGRGVGSMSRSIKHDDRRTSWGGERAGVSGGF